MVDIYEMVLLWTLTSDTTHTDSKRRQPEIPVVVMQCLQLVLGRRDLHEKCCSSASCPTTHRAQQLHFPLRHTYLQTTEVLANKIEVTQISFVT